MAPAKRSAVLWPALLTGVGLALRLASARAVFRGGNVYFVDPDDYYHLRRMMTAAADFPRLPSFDHYLGFPSGFHCNWPPLYDWLAGWLMIGANLRAAQIIAAFIPPVAGTITLWLFYKVAARVVERRAALWALGIAALLPMPAMYTMLGRPDHHSPENLFFLFVLTIVLDRMERDEKLSWKDALVPAAALAAGVLCWIGSIVFVTVFFLFALWELLPRRSPPRFVEWLAEVFADAGIIIAPFCLLSHWGAAFLYDFDAPSPFQCIILAATSALTVALWSHRAGANKKIRNLFLATGVLFFIVLAYKSVSSWSLFAGAPLPVFRLATEMQPLLKPFGGWSGDYVGAFFGWSLWLIAPLGWLFYKGSRAPERRLILVWTAVTGALALWQTRYAYHFSYPVALLLGFGVDLALSRVRIRSKAGAWGLVLCTGVLVLGHALMNSAGLALADARDLTIDADLIETCEWLRTHTPPTRSLWKDEGSPEYGIYALHDFGGPIASIAQRPAAAGNMHVMRRQILDSSAFFFMDSEDQAREFLRSRRFRYVVLSDMIHNNLLATEAGGLGIQGVTRHLWDLVYMRLYSNNGAVASTGSRLTAPVAGFRLVHESPTRSNGVARFKVFELVPGAAVSGNCEKGLVSASVALQSDQSRAFDYRTFALCERHRFTLNLPYPGCYDLVIDQRRRALDLVESSVVGGASIDISATSAASRRPSK